jgi:hypothetical protein
MTGAVADAVVHELARIGHRHRGEVLMRLRSFLLACGSALAVTLPAGAHHSHVNYAVSEFTFLEGVVTEVHLINPHSWIYLEVLDEQGEAALWALETTNPAGLERVGIERDFVKVGDRIKVRCHRQRDNENACLLGFLTPLHGEVARGHGLEKEWD